MATFGLVQNELNRMIDAQGGSSGPYPENSELPVEGDNADRQSADIAASRSLRLAQDAKERELRAALKSFESNEATGSLDNSARLEQAATFRQVADIDFKQGNTDEAIKYYQRAIEITSDLLRHEPKSAAYAEQKARSLVQLAETLAYARRIDESLTAFAAALDVCEDASRRFGYDSWAVNVASDAWTTHGKSVNAMCAARCRSN